MKTTKNELIPIVREKKVKGYVNLPKIRAGLLNGKAKMSDPVEDLSVKEFFLLPNIATLGRIAKVLEKELFVFIYNEFVDEEYLGVITQQSLFDFVYA